MKKLLCIAITLCTILSAFAQMFIIASAEDNLPDTNLNIIYKNADADEISITFDKEINITNAANYLLLEKDGNAVSIVCADGFDAKGSTATKRHQNIMIRPAAGSTNQIELGEVYTLTVKAGLTSTDGTKTLKNDVIWSFSVEEIFRDDFESGSLDKWSAGENAVLDIVNNSSLNPSNVLSVTSSTANPAIVWPGADYFPSDITNYNIKYEYVHTVPCYISAYSDDVGGTVNSLRLNANAYGQVRSYIWYTPEGGSTTVLERTDDCILHQYNGTGHKLSLMNGTVRSHWLHSGGTYLRMYEHLNTHLKGGMFSVQVDAGKTQYLDNVLITKVENYATSTLTVDGGLDNASVDTDVEIKFDYPVLQTEENENCILVSEDGQPIYNYDITYSPDGKTICLAFNSDLAYETDYTVEFTDGFRFEGDSNSYVIEPHTFTTCMAPFVIESFKLIGGNGEILSPDDASDSLSVEAKILNRNLADSVTCFATVCLYDSEGRMCAIAGNTYAISKGESATIKDTFELDGEDDYTVKCLVWQSPESMKKLLSKTIE